MEALTQGVQRGRGWLASEGAPLTYKHFRQNFRTQGVNNPVQSPNTQRHPQPHPQPHPHTYALNARTGVLRRF